MIDALRRVVRTVGTVVLIAAAPMGVFSISQATAQIPGLPAGMPTLGGEPYPLTSDLVLAWAQSYPSVIELTDQLDAQYNVGGADDPMAAMAGLGAVAAAMSQLNAAVATYGFTDITQWTNVMLAVTFSYAIVSAPTDQQAMLMGMFAQPQSNLDAVSANLDAVAAVIDN